MALPGASYLTTTPDGRFQLIDQIGAGAFGVVFCAHDVHFDHVVALKVFTTPGVQIDAVLNEVRIQKLSEHPNIVRVHHVDIGSPYPYLAMELHPTGSVAARINPDWGAPIVDAVRWTRAALGGLAHAHHVGVLHRDIRPSNILLNADGEALLGDFGLAEDTIRTRITSSAVYTLHAAPEVLAGQPSSIASDIWAMGATLYRLLTGRHPFASREEIWKGDYQPARTLNPQVPRSVERVLEEALRPDPADRFATAGRMREALSECRIEHSWVPSAPSATVEEWIADLSEGRARLRLQSTRAGAALEVSLDKGSGFRQVGGRPMRFSSMKKARQKMATIMRRTVEGTSLKDAVN